MENNKTNCNKFDQLLLDIDEKHLMDCSHCNYKYEEFISTWNILDNFQEINPSKNFMAKLQREIALLEEKKNRFWFKLDNFFLFAKGPITAVMFLFITLSNNSYAFGNKDSIDIKKVSPVIGKKIKQIYDVKVIDIFSSIKNISVKER